MDDYEIFGTKDEAVAFINGYETAVSLIDDDHTVISMPELTATGDWRVNYGHHC